MIIGIYYILWVFNTQFLLHWNVLSISIFWGINFFITHIIFPTKNNFLNLYLTIQLIRIKTQYFIELLLFTWFLLSIEKLIRSFLLEEYKQIIPFFSLNSFSILHFKIPLNSLYNIKSLLYNFINLQFK